MRRPARGGPSGIGLLAAFLLGGCLWLLFGLGRGGFFLRRGFLGCLFRSRFFFFVLGRLGLGLRLGFLLRSGLGFLSRSFFLGLGLELVVDELEDGYLG